MALPVWVEQAYMRLADTVVDLCPQPAPSQLALRACRLISHRGEFDNRKVFENTLAAFEAAAAAGVWGIECDVRWTRDLKPVLAHDADLQRVFGDHRRIRDFTRAQLAQAFPAVADLYELVRRYGGRLHLMVEFKQEPWFDPVRQNQELAHIFRDLRPVEDFHCLTLTPRRPSPFTFVSEQGWVPIAAHWADDVCRAATARKWSGVCGHYSMMRTGLIRGLKRGGKRVGTGYADSVNCLYRELNRGVDWIFSNRAAAMQSMVKRALRACRT